jgi:hypothetical protein
MRQMRWPSIRSIQEPWLAQEESSGLPRAVAAALVADVLPKGCPTMASRSLPDIVRGLGRRSSSSKHVCAAADVAAVRSSSPNFLGISDEDLAWPGLASSGVPDSAMHPAISTTRCRCYGWRVPHAGYPARAARAGVRHGHLAAPGPDGGGARRRGRLAVPPTPLAMPLRVPGEYLREMRATARRIGELA